MPPEVDCAWSEVDVGDKTMSLYVCVPRDGAPHPAVVVLQEIFGVNRHIRTVAERVARSGYLAAAPDLFHRQQDRFESGYDDLAPGFEKMQKLRDDDALRDIGRVLATLRGRSDVRKEHVGVMGFCMGGRMAFLTAGTHDVQAAVCFYGGGIARSLAKAPPHRCPLLLFFGADDSFIPQEDVKAIEAAVAAQPPPAEVVVYPNAGHGFFCDERASYHQEAADDAWTRTREFFAKTLAG